MRWMNAVTLLLLIIGGLNWLAVGLFNYDIVAGIFGAQVLLSRAIYVLVGLSAIYQLVPLSQYLSSDTDLRSDTDRRNPRGV